MRSVASDTGVVMHALKLGISITCVSDMTNLNDYLVGEKGLGRDEFLLVSADICTNTDKSTLDDAFRAFPSGTCEYLGGR